MPDVQEVLSNIHVVRATNAVEQLAAVLSLPRLLDGLPGVRVVILDSIAFHFRHTGGESAGRTHDIKAMGRALTAAAVDYGVAVVVTNHVTNRRHPTTGQYALVPALGDTWSHLATHRLLLYWDKAVRAASLVKSATRPPGTCLFSVTADGVRRVRTGSK